MARQQQNPSRRMFYLDPRSRTVSKCADRANERMAEIVQRVAGELAIKEIERVVRLSYEAFCSLMNLVESVRDAWVCGGIGNWMLDRVFFSVSSAVRKKLAAENAEGSQSSQRTEG